MNVFVISAEKVNVLARRQSWQSRLFLEEAVPHVHTYERGNPVILVGAGAQRVGLERNVSRYMTTAKYCWGCGERLTF